MELLVSGFAIVLLAQAFYPVVQHLNTVRAHIGGDRLGEALGLSAQILILFAILVTVVSLSVSVTLRCLWIAAVGLRSISGDIDLQSLRLAPRFNEFLGRRLPPFDDYIVGLERICSSIFSLTFLTLFALVGTVLATLVYLMPLLLLSTHKEYLPVKVVMMILLLLPLPAFLIAVIDFLSGSRLKRVRWLSRVYYPVYRLLGWITLARLYRPLYYNLVDTRAGRLVVLGVVPYFVLIASLFVVDGTSFTPLTPRGGDFGFGSSRSYGDSDSEYFALPFLGQRVAEGDLVEVYLPLEFDAGALVIASCRAEGEAYRQVTERRSVDGPLAAQRLDGLTACLGRQYQLKVDQRALVHPEFAVTEYRQTEQSFLYTVLATDTLPPGRHYLSVYMAKTDTLGHISTIPFFVP